MQDHSKPQIANLDPQRDPAITESGELERPSTFRRKIDCAGVPEHAERRTGARGGRFSAPQRRTGSP